jgi:hypothetical protein
VSADEKTIPADKNKHPYDGEKFCEPTSHRDEKKHPDIQNYTTPTLQEHHQMPPQIDHSLPLDPHTSSTYMTLPIKL